MATKTNFIKVGRRKKLAFNLLVLFLSERHVILKALDSKRLLLAILGIKKGTQTTPFLI